MSATYRGGERSPADNYPTPFEASDPVIDYILDRMGPVDTFLDPCCGEGAILRRARERGCASEFFGIDIRKEAISTVNELGFAKAFEADLLNLNLSVLTTLPPKTAIVTNPPFRLAEPIANVLLNNAPKGAIVAMLLRTNWVNCQSRRSILHGPHGLPREIRLARRPNFIAFGVEVGVIKPEELYKEGRDGKPKRRTGDASDYSWFLWEIGNPSMDHGTWTVHYPTPKEASR